jgi:hypothetical protein
MAGCMEQEGKQKVMCERGECGGVLNALAAGVVMQMCHSQLHCKRRAAEGRSVGSPCNCIRTTTYCQQNTSKTDMRAPLCACRAGRQLLRV